MSDEAIRRATVGLDCIVINMATEAAFLAVVRATLDTLDGETVQTRLARRARFVYTGAKQLVRLTDPLAIAGAVMAAHPGGLLISYDDTAASVVELDRWTLERVLRASIARALDASVVLPRHIATRYALAASPTASTDERMRRFIDPAHIGHYARLLAARVRVELTPADEARIRARAFARAERAYDKGRPVQPPAIDVQGERHELSDRLFGAAGVAHPRFFRRTQLILAAAYVLLTRRYRNRIDLWQSVDLFYLVEFCLLELRYGAKTEIGASRDSIAAVCKRLAFRAAPDLAAGTPAEIGELVLATLNAPDDVRASICALFQEHQLHAVLDAFQFTHTTEHRRQTAWAHPARRVTADEVAVYIDENALMSARRVLRERQAQCPLAVFFAFSAHEVTPLQLVTSVRTFAAEARDGVDFLVVWAPSSYARSRRIASLAAPVYLCMTAATWRVLSLGALPLVLIQTRAASELMAPYVYAGLTSGDPPIAAFARASVQALLGVKRPVIAPGEDHCAARLATVVSLFDDARLADEVRRPGIYAPLHVAAAGSAGSIAVATQAAAALVASNACPELTDFVRGQLAVSATPAQIEVARTALAQSQAAARLAERPIECGCGVAAYDCVRMQNLIAADVVDCCLCAFMAKAIVEPVTHARIRREACAGCTSRGLLITAGSTGAYIPLYLCNAASRFSPADILVHLVARGCVSTLFALCPMRHSSLITQLAPTPQPTEVAPLVAATRRLLADVAPVEPNRVLGLLELLELTPLAAPRQLTDDERARACNGVAFDALAQQTALFPLCRSAVAETMDDGAYATESSASNWLLPMQTRAELQLYRDKWPLPLSDSLPLFLPLALANFHANEKV